MLKLVKWHCICLCIFCLMILTRMAMSQPSCPLDFRSSSAWYNSSCEGGDWDGFLGESCCSSGFNRYLYSLGERSNRTGLIFLSPEEQRSSCLAEIGSHGSNVSDCGLERLTSGNGGCSDLVVADVNNRFADQLKSLTGHCRLESGFDDEWNRSCGECAQSWRDIGLVGLVTDEEKASKMTNSADDYVCRFATLVVLTSSRTDDADYDQKLYRCLGDRKTDAVPGPANDNESVGENGSPTEKEPRPILKVAQGIWIPVAALLGVAVVGLVITFIVPRYCRKNRPLEKNAIQGLKLKESDCTRFPLKAIYSATKNLDATNLIGEGNSGKVYKGVLSNKKQVAIKHIIHDGNMETVVREVMNLSHVRHPNLVTLLGYCARQDECFLVYELCPNGNLSQWIFGKGKMLSWIQRLHIAVDTARGLWFLHTYPEGCIVHRDIKPTNILLGPNFEAKLSDFGLSKVIELGETNASSEVRGTFGYVDPEYQSNKLVNSSGDVYSFGVVLLQILSGKRVINMDTKRPVLLDKRAKSLTRGGSPTEFADPKLEGEYSAEAFILTFELALSCTGLKHERPSMEQVVLKLEQALDISVREADPTSSQLSIP